MFEWLFPNWSAPASLAALVGVKLLLDVALTALVAATSAVGESRWSALTVVAAGLAVVSTVLTVLVLRGTLGLGASYVGFLVHAALLVLAGYAVYSTPSSRRRVAVPRRVTVPVFLGAIAVALVLIPLYGEATVAP